jgi:hypothetical protein
LKSAVRAPPICRKPVGEGAKRVTTVMAQEGIVQGSRGFCRISAGKARRR